MTYLYRSPFVALETAIAALSAWLKHKTPTESESQQTCSLSVCRISCITIYAPDFIYHASDGLVFEKKRNVYKILARIPQRKRTLGRSSLICVWIILKRILEK
jgi:hypothetical protein